VLGIGDHVEPGRLERAEQFEPERLECRQPCGLRGCKRIGAVALVRADRR